MTDLNKTIMEKAQGNVKLNPDEQRKFLETFAERVIATCSLEEVNNPNLKEHFKDILTEIAAKYQPVFIKISPELESKEQIFFMKIAKELGCEATIVSSNCQHSPFALVIHTDQPVDLKNKDLFAQYPDLLGLARQQDNPPKQSFWKKLFQ
ncbi:DUF1694 domain-containing protein [Streptococcus massiliensis]|uniref:Uncharacterized conserved protein n=1 Tax=Streptococcus massiliensis TaxID=313439 RepID=A0A380KWV2_9STRE|nr:DUF1694 domain-containing protein [Streptococcus massiliensis]SUN76238.1 Uncharacterized conserved protein [Streptococcus massiliensis]